jgi:valyl-tRNA synthetase
MELFVKKNQELSTSFDSVIVKMGNLSQLSYVSNKVVNAYSFMVQSNEFFIPFGEMIDLDAERIKIEEELEYTKGFLKMVQQKLTNEKFVSGAPVSVVVNEQKKEADAIQKIAILEDKLSSLV